MKIALLGYGKMGKIIERIALQRNHKVVLKIARDNAEDLTEENLKLCDVAIEFSTPHTAVNHVLKCFDAKVPVVIGTTGWQDDYDTIKNECISRSQTMLYASNFSIGVNVFFELNKFLARMMNKLNDYDVYMEEIHHVHKKDKPSGTGITLAEGIIEVLDRKKSWVEGSIGLKDEIAINCIREQEVPGTHSVNYTSAIDQIEIKHVAKSREGFAQGAVIAAEWLKGKTGVYSMQDVLQL